MKKILFLSLFCLLFSCYHFYSNDLIQIRFRNSYTLYIESSQKFNSFKFVEIFTPFEFLNISYSNGNLKFVLQASFILKSKDEERIYLQSNKPITTFWYRVIDGLGVIPENYISSNNLNLIVNVVNDWYTSVNYSRAISKTESYRDFLYELWVVPIFPKGQYISWSNDLDYLNDDLIISAINKARDPYKLKNIGKLITRSTFQGSFNLINRKTYTHLIIIQATINDTTVLQYPPIIIYGCSFMNVFSSSAKGYFSLLQTPNLSCLLIGYSRIWYIIIICISILGILFVIFGHFWESLQSFVSGSCILAFISCIVVRYFFNHVYESEVYLFVMLFGVPPAVSLFCSIILAKCCKKENPFSTIFSILLLIVIQWSVMWFGLVPIVSNIILFVSNAVLSIILLVLLLVYKKFVLTVGSTFIGMSITCIGLSTVFIKSSTIPYLLLDFFNFIIYKRTDIYYFSYFLYNDLIVTCFWIFVTVVWGILAYKSMLRRHQNTRVESPTALNDVSPQIIPATYGALRMEYNVNLTDVTTTPNDQLFTPPPYTAKPTAPVLQDKPPPYPGFV